MGLQHAVITSVSDDDNLGGAKVFVMVIQRIRELHPAAQLRCLSDFRGDIKALEIVMDEHPEILNHNLETVPRRFRVQPSDQLDYCEC